MKSSKPQISIIIPVLNEGGSLDQMLRYLRANSCLENIKEILIVDGGSEDATLSIASNHDVIVLNSTKGRAKQMNLGAKKATGDILYFLHVDTTPPKGFDQNIIAAVLNSYEAGCFQMKFDSSSYFLNFFAWFTKLNLKICRGGDQSLFVTKTLFKKSGGFNENYVVYEDNEFIGRLYDMAPFKVLSQHVKTSARRYQERGTIALQYHFGIIHLKNYVGAGPEELHAYYKKKIAI